MSARLNKICSDSDRTTAKISELQDKLKELGRQKMEQENTEIVELVRSIEATPEKLAEMIKVFRGKGGGPIKTIVPKEDLNDENDA